MITHYSCYFVEDQNDDTPHGASLQVELEVSTNKREKKERKKREKRKIKI